MLILQQQFLLNYSARRPVDIINPKIFKDDTVPFTRFFIFHEYNIDNDSYFINIHDEKFNSIAKNKKIYVYNVNDYTVKEGSMVKIIKLPDSLIRKWVNENKSKVRAFDTIDPLPTDSQTTYVVNYSLLKHIYNYTSIPINEFYKYYNFNKTIYDIASVLAKNNPMFKNIITIHIPNIIPSIALLNIIMKFNPIKYSRVIKNNDLKDVIEFFKWILDEPSTTMSSITEDITDRIIFKFYYKGYCSYIPSNIIYSIKENSTLDSSLKLSNNNLLKLLYRYIIKLQSSIDKIILEQDKNNSKDILEDDHTEDKDNEDIEENKNINDDIDDTINNDNSSEDEEIKEDLNKYDFTNVSKYSENKIKDIDKIDKNLNKIIQTSNDIDNIFNDEDLYNDYKKFDDIFLNEIEKVSNTKEDENIIIDHKPNKEPSNEIITIDVNNSIDETLIRDENAHLKIDKRMNVLLKSQLISNSEYNMYKKQLNHRLNLKSPYNNETLDKFKEIKEEDLKINEEDKVISINNKLVSDNLKKDTINILENKYNKNIIQKDIISCVSKIEDALILITDYEVTEDKSALGHYEIHKISLKPLQGKESTIYMRFPKINNEGEFIASGIKYKTKKQRSDLPIRKISHDKVALSSYYGKLFINRTDKKAYDYYDYINSVIKDKYISEDNKDIEKLVISSVYNHKNKIPSIAASLSSNFKTIETNEYYFEFDMIDLVKFVEEKTIKEINNKGYYCCGYNKLDRSIIICDFNDYFYKYNANGSHELIGSMHDLLNIDDSRVPISFSEIIILGKKIPLGVIISYYLGLENLIKYFKLQANLIPKNKRYTLQKDEFIIKFSDYNLVINKKNKAATLLLAGFNYFRDYTKLYEYEYFNGKEIYNNILLDRGYSNLHIKEIDILRDLYLDPITIDVLKQINEPHEFIPLLFRANELLTTFDYPDVNDPSYSRIKGYERIPGLMYKTLVKSVRNYKFKNTNNAKIELDPYAVWNEILTDTAKKITEDINPIVDLKEKEAVTLGGSDGLSKDSVQVKLRSYHENDMGLISEATVDSSDVAVNTFLTPSAKINNIRGLVDTKNKDYRENPQQLLSTSALLAPFVENDDPKRVNFINIQNGHIIGSSGYEQPIIRTEYEYVMPYRVGSLYSVLAKDDCTVVEVNQAKITVRYKDGTLQSYNIGRIFGVAEGTTYPHNIVTQHRVGDKLKKGDYICYNENFFEPDWLDNGKLIFKTSRLFRVALSETPDVFEDSCSISNSFSNHLKTKITKQRSFVIEFNKNIINMINVGTTVEPNDILFTILDENVTYDNLNKDSVRLLQNLNNISPRAKYRGVIEKYEVYYNGNIEDMSETLQKVVKTLDKQKYLETKNTEHEVKNNRVTSEYRVDGANLLPDTLELRVYITIDLKAGVGDKVVFASQLKSVIGDVFDHKLLTEDGKEVDALFAFRGIYNRVVVSPILMGTTNILMKKLNELATKTYFST